MTFTPTITGYGNVGNRRLVRGTWSTDTTGGNIDTGLKICEHMKLTPDASTSAATDCGVDETMPCAGSAVTIAVTSGVDGVWEAIGY